MVEKYGEDVSVHPEFDADAWTEAVGKINRGHLYGFGTAQNPKVVLGTTTNASTSDMDASQQQTQVPNDELVQQLVKQALEQQLPQILQNLGYQPTITPTSRDTDVPTQGGESQTAPVLNGNQIHPRHVGGIQRTSVSVPDPIQRSISEDNDENIRESENDSEDTASDYNREDEDGGDNW